MMVIDTSAVIAILENERERRAFNEAIERAERCLMSAASYVEASILIETRRGYDGARDFDLFAVKAGIEVIAVDGEQAEIAGRVQKVRQGAACGQAEFRGLFFRCAGKGDGRSPALQGR